MKKAYLEKLHELIRKPDLYVILAFGVLILFFLLLTGTLNSGYHFIDDHWMVRIFDELKDRTYLSVVSEHVLEDFDIRFRPLFYIYYITVVWLFGINFTLISIFFGALAWLNFTLFYLGARKLNYSIFLSILFVLLAFVGSQSAIWWRLGTNETLGMTFLSIGFYSLAASSNLARYRFKNGIFIISLILASLSKESFVVVIPAFVMFKILNEKFKHEISYRKALRNNFLSIFLLLTMVIELIMIKFYVGTNEIGYAGMTSSVQEFVNGLKNIFFNAQSIYYWILLIIPSGVIFILSGVIKNRRDGKLWLSLIHNILPTLVFVILLVASNIFIYAKSGMTERYLLPSTLGLSLLFVLILRYSEIIYLKAVILLLGMIFLYQSIDTAVIAAEDFTYAGEVQSNLLENTVSNSNEDDLIVVVVDPVDNYEMSWSIKMYLLAFERENIQFFPIEGDYDSEYKNQLLESWYEMFMSDEIYKQQAVPDTIIIVSNKDVSELELNNLEIEKQFDQIGDTNSPYQLYDLK